MRLKSIELSGFKSFAKRTVLEFPSTIIAVVGPNGSGKSNVAESFRFVLGEQSMKSMRGKRGEDMIWNGSSTVPRAGRASVKLLFDNSDRALNLDFDEVSIERVVHRDGQNEYILNGSIVRLRDISELLAQANIGASGHHIISQGEADRVLTASSRERREMLQDALGLTAYLYKREEAQRKLGKTAENIHEVESLRREILPHLRFLQGQVKKIEDASRLREELSQKYLEYLKRESVYLSLTREQIVEERTSPEEEYTALQNKITLLREDIESHHKGGTSSHEVVEMEARGRELSRQRQELTREEGRIEGELAARKRLATHVEEAVPRAQVLDFAQHTLEDLQESATLGESALRSRIPALIVYIQEFVRRMTTTKHEAESAEDLTHRKVEIEQKLQDLQEKETQLSGAIASVREKIENEKDASRDAERELFAGMARRSELESILSSLRSRQETLEREEEAFRLELGEAGALIGMQSSGYTDFEIRSGDGELLTNADIGAEDRAVQIERHRKLERLKVRLEETGLGNSEEVLREHQETTERDAFLARELQDLEASIEKLEALIADLSQTLQERFTHGIEKINTEFDNFFKLMFGGGTASLALVEEQKNRRVPADMEDEGASGLLEEEEETEEGVEIAISLPHKRVKGLHMLSGGERALTSIALIFAMSQVNPPPFIILDETDAALDEANSRRYGDMIESLAKHSQLIVITHNRETMSRAGILYGITMGSDSLSKLLSVKFEEALAVAK